MTDTQYYCHCCGNYSEEPSQVTDPESDDFDELCCPYCRSTSIQMQTGNTYTYKQSELPPLRDEIQKEIAELDYQIGNLISRCAGNFHELEALSEVLDNCADSCELNLNSIRVIPDSDDSSPKSSHTFSELQEILLSTSLACSFLAQILSKEVKVPESCIMEEISKIVENAIQDLPPGTASRVIDSLKGSKEAGRRKVHVIEITKDGVRRR